MFTMYPLDPIKDKLASYKSRGMQVFMTSSFQTHSIPLLHIISQIDASIPIYFLDTGYHFPETLTFRDEVSKMLNLNLKVVKSSIPKSMQKDDQGHLLFASNIDYCCYLNKVQPLEPVIDFMDVWISGVRAQQNNNRKNLKEEERTPNGKLRYHPVLDWTNKMIYSYARDFNLPSHPLEAKGYLSVGCEPCTRSAFEMNEERGGRWAGMKKTECGLHTELIQK